MFLWYRPQAKFKLVIETTYVSLVLHFKAFHRSFTSRRRGCRSPTSRSARPQQSGRVGRCAPFGGMESLQKNQYSSQRRHLPEAGAGVHGDTRKCQGQDRG